MRGEVLRSLLVVSERPHPWAFLRDRLDPELVRVAWARPGDLPAVAEALAPALWAVAGGGQLPRSIPALHRRLVAWHWVGDAPPDPPVRPVLHGSWREAAARLRADLTLELGGLRLAPGRGLVDTGGSYVLPGVDVESLLCAQPDGIELAGRGASSRARAAARRLRTALRRHRLPLRVVDGESRLVLRAATEGVPLAPLAADVGAT